MTYTHSTAENSELGKKTAYESQYNPDKLFPIPRESKRKQIGIQGALPFYGYDLWNHYEVSWLNEKGKPIVALAEIIYGCDSENIIESKSMKLYFNTFNNTIFSDVDVLKSTIIKDLKEHLKTSLLEVNIIPLYQVDRASFQTQLDGISIDEQDIDCSIYQNDPSLLFTEDTIISETLCTDLLKSNCLVTHQPDWCSVQISYKGKKINREGLLRYIVSFRNDNEFHEQCIEKIFMQIMQQCQPEALTVYGRSTRRGGLDINSLRSTEIVKTIAPNLRMCRQ